MITKIKRGILLKLLARRQKRTARQRTTNERSTQAVLERKETKRHKPSRLKDRGVGAVATARHSYGVTRDTTMLWGDLK